MLMLLRIVAGSNFPLLTSLLFYSPTVSIQNDHMGNSTSEFVMSFWLMQSVKIEICFGRWNGYRLDVWIFCEPDLLLQATTLNEADQ